MEARSSFSDGLKAMVRKDEVVSLISAYFESVEVDFELEVVDVDVLLRMDAELYLAAREGGIDN